MLCYTLNYHSGRSSWSHLGKVLGLFRSCPKGKKKPKNEEEAKKKAFMEKYKYFEVFKYF